MTTPLTRLMTSLLRFFAAAPAGLRAGIALGMTAAVAYFDYVTPAYAFLIGFYFVPIFLAIWFCGLVVTSLVLTGSVAMSLYMTTQELPGDATLGLSSLVYLSVLFVYISWVGLMFYLKALFARLKEESQTDELTGLRSRRAFMELAQFELARSYRSGEPMLLAIIDLDNFKLINDTQGHAAGDALLVAASRCMTAGLREIDVVGRLGGDEFVILLPGTDAPEGHGILGRLHSKLTVLLQSFNPRVTASMGAVEIPAGSRIPMAQALERADEAMYELKKQSKNAYAIVPFKGDGR